MDNHTSREKAMEELERLMDMSLYEFISGQVDLDTTMIANLCLDKSVDINVIYGAQARVKRLLNCLRGIYIEHCKSRGLSDPFFHQSSSPNVCNIQ